MLVVEGKEKAYLLLEDSGQRPKLWIGEDTLDGIALILEEDLYISDYYIVDKKYRWMITCNHHGVCCSWGMGWIWTGLQI